jgi:hypothetical protein
VANSKDGQFLSLLVAAISKLNSHARISATSFFVIGYNLEASAVCLLFADTTWITKWGISGTDVLTAKEKFQEIADCVV